jgi:hypothetical protein
MAQLGGTALHVVVQAEQELIASHFGPLAIELQARYGTRFTFTKPEVLWSMSMFRSRAFTTDVLAGSSAPLPSSAGCMVPLLDIFNHKHDEFHIDKWVISAGRLHFQSDALLQEGARCT